MGNEIKLSIERRPGKPLFFNRDYCNINELQHTLNNVDSLYKKINNEKEYISKIMGEIIGETKYTNYRKLIILRRRVYNRFDLDSLKQFLKIVKNEQMYFKKSKSLNVFKDNLISLNDTIDNLGKLLYENDNKMKEKIYKVILDDEFLRKIFVVNPKLAKALKNSKKVKTSQIKKVIQYFDKEEVFTTPSSCWSGLIDPCSTEETTFIEENLIKYVERMKNENVDIEAVDYQVNPTIINTPDTLKYYTFSNNTLNKINVPTNKLLVEIARNKILDYNLISEIAKKSNFSVEILIETLLKNDFLRIIYPVRKISVCGIKEIDHINDISKNYHITTTYPKYNIENKTDIKLKDSLNTYLRLYRKLYAQETNTNKNKFIQFMKKINRISFLEFLYSDFQFITRSYKDKNYRSFYQPRNKDGKNFYQYLLRMIREKSKRGEKVVKIQLNELIKNLENETIEFAGDIVYQINEEQKAYIFEMFSKQRGRLLMRYLKYLNISSESEYKDYIKEIQRGKVFFQVENHNDIDNIAFIDSKIQNCIIQDHIYKENLDANILYLNEVFFQYSEEKDDIIIVDINSNEIDINISTSASPGNNLLYTAINLLNNSKNKSVPNGQGLSRIELDLDYQPTVIIDNLLISRERVRILYSQFPNNAKSLLIKLKKYGIFPYFYYYTNSNYKPRYCNLTSNLDYWIMKQSLESDATYVYIESFINEEENGYIKERMVTL